MRFIWGESERNLYLRTGGWAWAKRPARYVKDSVTNVEKYLAELADMRWQFLKKKSENPFVGDYAPEMGDTPALEQDLASW